ncbi:ImmA/IrrE family metallo-endopeptidase [Lactococcus garvieae]|uniref:ImmA/IrrE family metallo-endopeptidase n=1 Tax=Lactococcus garvieae TaxID=1363 RepID=UPI003D7753F7
MDKSEFILVPRDRYSEYLKKANHILSEISIFNNKKIIELGWKDVTSFFENKYDDLIICFFDDGTYEYRNFDSGGPKYPSIFNVANVKFLDEETVQDLSGMSLPEDEFISIMINQKPAKSRVIFTALHELVHSYYHIRNKNTKQYFTLLGEKIANTGHYPSNVQKFEDEANVIASILMLNQERLEKYFLDELSFYEIMNRTDMSESALISRLKNYFYNIHKINEFELASIVYPFKEGQASTIHRIKKLIIDRSNIKKIEKRYIYSSSGLVLDKNNTKDILKSMSIENLDDICKKEEKGSDLYWLAYTERTLKEKYGNL